MRQEQNKTTSSSSQSLLSNTFELREEDLFGLFSEQLPDSMYLLDLDDQDVPGKIIYTNDAACRIHGYTREEMIGRSINELDKEDEARKSDSRLDKLRSGEVLTFEEERRRMDGTPFPVEVTARMVEWKGRRVAFTIDRDISDRKQTEDALQSSEFQFDNLITASERQAREMALLDRVRTILAKEMDLQIVYRTIVEAVADTFGYTHISLYLLKDDYLHAQYFVGYKQVVTPIPLKEGITGRVVRTGEPALVEDVSDDPDHISSTEGTLSDLVVPIIDQGAVLGTLNIESVGDNILSASDLTMMIALSEHIGVAIGRARLYSEARASEARYRNLVEQLNDVIFTLNTQGQISYISPAIQRYSGHTAEELLGRPFAELMDQQEGPMMMGHVQEMMAGGGAPFEFRVRVKDGERRWVRSSARTLMNEEGATEIIGMLTDITDRKRMEEERVKFSKLESLGVLAGGIAHDFNNLLTGVVGNMSIASLTLSPDDPINENLKNAEEALSKAKDLTYQLLTFAKGGTPVKTLVSLKDLLSEIAPFILRGANSRHELELGDGLWRIEADTNQISQVFQNIIINADQAMPDGGVIFIKAANMTAGPDQMPDDLALSPGVSYVRIDILDQGGGIAPEQMSKIFDPYFSTKDEGTGLGLATAHSVITQHGGTITVESRLGQGTTFTVYLPATTTMVEELAPEDPETEFTALDVGEHDGHILVLDDEEMILSLVKQILTRFGYSVVVSTDGAETLSLYQEALMTQQPFDMVILDLTIPGGKGGKDVIQELRALNPNVHAIVSSGYYNDPVLANYREYGFDGMVAKPYKVHDLLQVIQKTLTGSSS